MNLYFDLDQSLLLAAPRGHAISRLTMKRGDAVPLQVYFYRGRQKVAYAPGGIVFGLKLQKQDEDVLAITTGAVPNDGGWLLILNTNTEELVDALAGANSIDVWGELTFAGPLSSQDLRVRILQDVLLGEEGSPGTLPSSDEFIAARAVLYDREQELSGPQREQARENIDAAHRNFEGLEGIELTLDASGTNRPGYSGAYAKAVGTINGHPYFEKSGGYQIFAEAAVPIPYWKGQSGSSDDDHLLSTLPLADPRLPGALSFAGQNVVTGTASMSHAAGGENIDDVRPGDRLTTEAGRIFELVDDEPEFVWKEIVLHGQNLSAPLVSAIGGTYVFGDGGILSQLVSPGTGMHFWLLPGVTATLAHTGSAAQTFSGAITINGQVEAPNQLPANDSRLLNRLNLWQVLAQGRHIKGNWAGWNQAIGTNGAFSHFVNYEPWVQMGTGAGANSDLLVRNSTAYRTWLYGKPGESQTAMRWNDRMMATVRFIMTAATDANTLVIWRWGTLRTSDTIGNLDRRGIGFRIENLALKLTVHDGTTLTVIDPSINLVVGTVYALTFATDGAGNYQFLLNGTLIGSTALGPAGTGGNGDHQIACSLQNGASGGSRGFYFEPLEVFYP